MKKLAITLVLLGAIFTSSLVTATTIVWNTQGYSTNVAAGFLSFDELRSNTTHTYVNVGGGNFDLKVTSSALMVYSTGDLNYTAPNSSLQFEFFATGTSNPVAVSGFFINWLDLDKDRTAGPFRIVDVNGVSSILNTSSSYFTLGSSISTVDLDGTNGVSPDGLKSSSSGNWNNSNISFSTSLAIHSFTLMKTTDWIAPTGTCDVHIIPEPSTLFLLGTGLLGFITYTKRRNRKR